MSQAVTITHRITDKGVATTLRMPGKPPMTKTWKQMKDGSFMLDTCNTWEDEDLPPDISDAAERCPHAIVGLLRDRAL